MKSELGSEALCRLSNELLIYAEKWRERYVSIKYYRRAYESFEVNVKGLFEHWKKWLSTHQEEVYEFVWSFNVEIYFELWRPLDFKKIQRILFDVKIFNQDESFVKIIW